MLVEVEGTTELRFGDGSPVRSASAVAPFGDGWLVVQDDATHAAWLRPGEITAVRVIDAVAGHETFSSAAGTKHLKPDFEAAVPVPGGVLLLGSGSTDARMRASLVTLPASGPAYRILDLTPVYHRVAAALGARLDQLNLEGACLLGDRLRWFQRGNAVAGVPSAAVDVAFAALRGAGLVAAGPAQHGRPADTEPARHGRPAGTGPAAQNGRPAGTGPAAQHGRPADTEPARHGRPADTGPAAQHGSAPGAGLPARPRPELFAVGSVRRYDLGDVGGVALAVTDAVALPDGRILVSAAAEDTPNAVDDGPVVGAALALLDDDRVIDVAPLPESGSGASKVEGIAVREITPGGVRLLAVADADDPGAASPQLELRVSW